MKNSEANINTELGSALKADTWLLTSAFFFSIFINLLMLTGPLFMLQVYDRVLGSRSEETLLTLFLLVVLLYGCMAVLGCVRVRIVTRFGYRLYSAFRGKVFLAMIQRSSMLPVDLRPARALKDLEHVRTLFSSQVVITVFDVMWTPLFLLIIFVFHAVLGWLAVAGCFALILITLLNNRLSQNARAEAHKHEAFAQGFADQARNSADFILSQGMDKSITKKWLFTRDKAEGLTIRSSDWEGLFSSVTKSFTLFFQSAMLATGAYLALQNELTAGAMIASSILVGRALAPIQQILSQWNVIQQASDSWSELKKLLANMPTETKSTRLPRPVADLHFSGVSARTHNSHKPMLSNLSFSLKAGEVLGVIGKSGSGKTTLSKAILGTLPITSGEVRLGGATLSQYSSEEIGKYIGYMPQDIALFSGTVAENICRFSQSAVDADIIDAARKANAHDMILSLPNGYNTVVNGSGGYLSGGQKQRIALARALYGNPVLLVLDEPNSALDSDGSEALSRAIRRAKQNSQSVVLMTHRTSALTECDRLLVINEGKVFAEGPRERILKTDDSEDPKTFRTVQNVQVQAS